MRSSFYLKGLAVGLLAGASWGAGTPQAQAQSALCPASIPGQAGFALENGACTNGITGAFSGAALATQALSALSQTTTQETVRTTGAAIAGRREREEQSCAEGFDRVDGVCTRKPSPVVEPVKVPTQARVSTVPVQRAKKSARAEKVTPVQESVPAPTTSVAVPQPYLPGLGIVRVEPGARFGAWTQVYGDYEKRNATGSASVACCISPTGVTTPVGQTINVQSRTGTVGFLTGADFTARSLLSANDGLIVGVLIGYVSSDLRLNTASYSENVTLAGNGFGRLNATLSGLTTGLYATYFNNGFSGDFMLRVDPLTLNETFDENLGFSSVRRLGVPVQQVAFSGSGSVSVTNSTLAGNVNYRFDLNPNLWLEPTVGAQYTHTSYGGGAVRLGLDDADLVMVQGGARLGIPVWLNAHTLMTTTVMGLAYSDVLVNGGFVPGAGFLADNILAAADQGQVRGRGVVAVNLDYGNGVSSFIQGEARGGKGLFGAGGRAGIRIVW
jgi:hypothetical protein